MLLTALAVVVGGYVAFTLALAGRMLLGGRRPTPPADLPRMAVVVAARDEAACIERCLDALLAQDVPPDRVDIIVADDHSTDGTADVVRAVVRRHARAVAGVGGDGAAEPPAVRVLPVSEGTVGPAGKARALHEAIGTTDAEILFVTDADCAPPPTWLRTTAAHFADPAVGIVCGLTRVRVRPGRVFDRVQDLDWTFLLGAISALTEAGAPPTGMGNNMAVRRAAYDAVGGYPELPFSVTEDFTLVRAVAEQTAFRVRFPISPATTVETLPAEHLAEAYRQRRRWARGGLTGGGWVLATYTGLFVTHLAPLLAIALAPVAGLGLLALKTTADAVLLSATLGRVGGRVRLPALLGFEAFVFLYLLTLPFALVLRPRIGWKGRLH